MATLAYWLIGRLYPTADVGLFFICNDLLKRGRGERNKKPQKQLYINVKNAKLHLHEASAKIYSTEETGSSFLSSGDNTWTVYKSPKAALF